MTSPELTTQTLGIDPLDAEVESSSDKARDVAKSASETAEILERQFGSVPLSDGEGNPTGAYETQLPGNVRIERMTTGDGEAVTFIGPDDHEMSIITDTNTGEVSVIVDGEQKGENGLADVEHIILSLSTSESDSTYNTSRSVTELDAPSHQVDTKQLDELSQVAIRLSAGDLEIAGLGVDVVTSMMQDTENQLVHGIDAEAAARNIVAMMTMMMVMIKKLEAMRRATDPIEREQLADELRQQVARHTQSKDKSDYTHAA